jgi:hypothetical protein
MIITLLITLLKVQCFLNNQPTMVVPSHGHNNSTCQLPWQHVVEGICDVKCTWFRCIRPLIQFVWLKKSREPSGDFYWMSNIYHKLKKIITIVVPFLGASFLPSFLSSKLLGMFRTSIFMVDRSLQCRSLQNPIVTNY